MRKVFYASAIALLGLAAVPVQAMTIAPLSGATRTSPWWLEGAAPVFTAAPTVVVFATASGRAPGVVVARRGRGRRAGGCRPAGLLHVWRPPLLLGAPWRESLRLSGPKASAIFKPAPHAAALGRAASVSMPAIEMRQLRRDRDPRRFREVERDKPGDVGDGEAVAGDEAPVAQGLVDNRHCPQRLRPVGRPPVRELAGSPFPPCAGGCGGRPAQSEGTGATRGGAATFQPTRAPAPSRRTGSVPGEAPRCSGRWRSIRRSSSRRRVRGRVWSRTDCARRIPASCAPVCRDRPRPAGSRRPFQPERCARGADLARDWSCRASCRAPPADAACRATLTQAIIASRSCPGPRVEKSQSSTPNR